MSEAQQQLFDLETPSYFITLRYDPTEDEWELDMGSVPHFEACGVLDGAARALKDRDPEIRIRFNGKAWDEDLYEDDDDDDEEETDKE